MTQTDLFLGVDLGGTDIKSAVVDRAGTMLWSESIGTEATRGREAVLEKLLGVMQRAASVFTPGAISGAGFAIPGVLDLATGRIELLTNFTPDWTGFALRDELQARSDLPCHILNDVRAATVAEHEWGAGRPYRDFICVAIGTGIGGGLVLNGELYTGSRGAAGELGHQTVVPDGPRCNCGNRGCLEAVASATAIARDARYAIAEGDEELALATGSHEPSPHQLAEVALQGNNTARSIFEGAGMYIGRAMAGLICALNPEAVVVGGGVALAGELLLEPIRREIERRTVVFSAERGGVDVVASPLGGHAGAMGAAAWAARQSTGVLTR